MNHVARTLLERIRREGKIDGEIIKVDLFLNHMVDPQLVDLLATELASRFSDKSIEKILTAETSGIVLAGAMARKLEIPFVYAKKNRPLTMGDFFAAASYSFTKQESTTLFISKEVLRPQERVIFVDDFYAKGATRKAIEDIIAQAQAMLVGSAVIINKSARRDIEAILTIADLRSS